MCSPVSFARALTFALTSLQDAGTRIEYDHDGSITSTATAPRAVGTTVALKDLFKTLPVRHKVRRSVQLGLRNACVSDVSHGHAGLSSQR